MLENDINVKDFKMLNASRRSASTGNFQIASPKSWWFCHSCRWQFVFHRDSTPRSRPCNCDSQYTNQQERGEKNQKKTYQPECPVSVDSQTVHFTFLYFQHIFIGKGYDFEWPVSWTLPGTWFSCFFVWACWLKKTYALECPFTVDWQFPDRESQILMVVS